MNTTQATEPVTVTDSAVEQIRHLLSQETEPAGKGLRLYIEKGGCSGLQYGMVFDERRPDDLVQERNGVSVYIDPFSADYLKGSVVDFVDSLNGGGFKITNPRARQSCGCGKSFET